MIYAVSDLHGCFEKYEALLNKIGFSDRDTLYVLGDVIDRGTGGIRILEDMMARKNVIPILGNHEFMGLPVLRRLLSGRSDSSIGPAYLAMWEANGSRPTLDAFLALSPEKRKAVVEFIEDFGIYDEITVCGRSFHLSHSLPALEAKRGVHDVTPEEFVWGEPDYEKVYDENTFFVTGHTPTGYIDPRFAGKIWRGNNHIAIDCGAVFGYPLGCVCLDTLEEIYAGE